MLVAAGILVVAALAGDSARTGVAAGATAYFAARLIWLLAHR
jgi:uncharacterized MAPEG superfamily protein